MSKFPVNTIDQAPEGSRPILEAINSAYGFVPNLAGMISNSPTAMKAYAALAESFDNSTFSPPEQQVVMLAVSYENRCAYCMSAHTMLAQQAGLSADNIEALRNGGKLSDDKLEALRHFTVKMVEKRGWLDKADVEAFINAGYTQAQVLEVVAGVALKTVTNYINHIAETPLDDAFAGTRWEAEGAGVGA